MQGNVRLYEIGSAFAPGESLPDETIRVAMLVMGDREPLHFAGPPPRLRRVGRQGLAERTARVAFPAAELRCSRRTARTDGCGASGRRRSAGRGARVALDAPVWAKPAFGVELVLGSMSNGDVAPPGEHAHGAAGAPAPRGRPYRPLAEHSAAEFDLALARSAGVTAASVDEVHPLRRRRAARAARRVRSIRGQVASSRDIARWPGG
jgi:hypothetical protein